ncbi:MAG: MucR family transcriptional regulator [Sphingomonadales bacterium]|nr:MucR family transcriptional regulator [Sphingomonadales bacterium]
MSQNLFGPPSIIACVTEIVSSHLSNNAVPLSDIPALMRSVHATLAELDPSLISSGAVPAAAPDAAGNGIFHFADIQPLPLGDAVRPQAAQRPAVPVEDSIHHDYIVCLEDGKRLRMLKRYLMTQFGMTPDDYRAKWGLPRTYPMAAPAVVEQRRVHAAQAGLGRKRRVEA